MYGGGELALFCNPRNRAIQRPVELKSGTAIAIALKLTPIAGG
jgi:hypothetical protein